MNQLIDTTNGNKYNIYLNTIIAPMIMRAATEAAERSGVYR